VFGVELDEIDYKILEPLRRDARTPFTEEERFKCGSPYMREKPKCLWKNFFQ